MKNGEPVTKTSFCLPAATFARLQATVADRGWKIGHAVEAAIEAFLDNPVEPVTRRRGRGRPKGWNDAARAAKAAADGGASP